MVVPTTVIALTMTLFVNRLSGRMQALALVLFFNPLCPAGVDHHADLGLDVSAPGQ